MPAHCLSSAATCWLRKRPEQQDCSASDLLFLLHGNQLNRTGAPTHSSLVQFHLSLLPQHIRGAWLLLATLAVLVLFIRMEWEIKYPLLGLVLSNLFLLVGDVFFSEAAVQMSHHAGYFVHATAAILFVCLLSKGFSHFRHRPRLCRITLIAAMAVLILNGILIAHATYQWFLADNEEHAELADALRIHPALASDLVVARAISVDDDCAWVPLVSSSHVLFCRNAQVLFTPEQNQQIQRFRQALYLYFTSKDSRWLESVLADPAAESELSRLTFLGELSSPQEKTKGIDAIRAELIPLLRKAGQNDAEVRAFFARYRHILIIDNAAKPLFDVSRLSSYLRIESQQGSGQLVILTCSPLPL